MPVVYAASGYHGPLRAVDTGISAVDHIKHFFGKLVTIPAVVHLFRRARHASPHNSRSGGSLVFMLSTFVRLEMRGRLVVTFVDWS